MVFSTRFTLAIDCDEPGIRNSNLFPVNANGEVRLRSEESMENFGSTCTPISTSHFARLE